MDGCARYFHFRKIVLFTLISTFAVPEPCSACIWDYDTLQMERQQFPAAHELIAGHFVRHSNAYYEWRIADRSAKNRRRQTPADFDDIAVAYDKLGQHEKAIETIQAKMERWPNEGRYESLANLGTFFIHAGQFDEGLRYTEQAIELNPQAHFGREIYQKLLVEYVAKRREGDRLPINPGNQHEAGDFAAFVLAARRPEQKAQGAEIQAAAQGIMGMMRFGKHDSPILLEALGDLMLSDSLRADAKMLAARAYLKASYAATDDDAVKAYRQKAEQALDMQREKSKERDIKLPEIEAALQKEIKQGEALFAQISRDEAAWIAGRKNVDAEFAKKYYRDPPLKLDQSPKRN